jgi:predicted GNAT family N-acyltransferase
MHFVALIGENVIGTARLRFIEVDCAKIERMAVLKPFRRSGVGRGIIACVETELISRGVRKAILHAQITAKPFYDACGYVAEGPHFYEAGIEHVKMVKVLP